MKDKIEVYYVAAGRDRWYWRRRAPNGRIVATAHEGYRTRTTVARAVARERAQFIIKPSVEWLY